MKKILLLVTTIFGLIAILHAQNNCLDFDGTDDYVTVADNNSLDLSSTITIEFWVNTSLNSGQTVICKSVSDADENYRIKIDPSGNLICFDYGDGSQYAKTNSITISINTWYHIAFSVSAGDMGKIYVNGIEATLDGNGSVAPNPIPTNNADMLIGNCSFSDNFFNGKLDEVRIWNDIRSVTEISENMCQTLVGDEDNLVALYKFDETTGSNANDSQSGSSNDGVLNNMVNDYWVDSEAFTTWNGSVGSVWTNDNNWTDGAPGSTDNVGIPNKATAPIIGSLIECNQLVVGNGVTLEFNHAGSHTIHGSAFVIGRSDIKNGNFLTVTKSLYILPLSTLIIDPGGELTIGNKLVNWAACTIQSTSSGTGSLIVEGSYSGNPINIQRYIAAWGDASHGWHFLSSPVTSQSISTQFVNISGNISSDLDFYRWSELEDLWINIKKDDDSYNNGSLETNFSNDADPKFEIGKGYLVAYESNKDKTFVGSLNTEDVSKSGLTYTADSDHTGWNLLGNPYQSALEWNKTDWARNNINATAKIWNETNASYTDIIKDTDDDVIPAMQGFMVEVSAAGTGSLNIDASDRVHDDQNWYKNTETNKIKLIAYDTEGSTAQRSIIRVNENATTGFDSEFDSHFLAGYAPQFYSVISDGEIVSTNALPELTSVTTIPMSFIKNNSSTFYIEVEGINTLEPQETVYLTDLKTNHTQILNDESRYDFTSEEGDIAERFLIHFSPLSITNNQLSEQLNIFSSNSSIEIRSNKPIDATINIYNIAGQLITTSQLNNESSVSVNITDYKGVAIVSVTTSGQTINEKVIVW